MDYTHAWNCQRINSLTSAIQCTCGAVQPTTGALAQARAEGYAQGIEDAAKVCDVHRPPPVRTKGNQLSSEAYASIQDEGRGETIAAEILAKAIRALSPRRDG